MMQVDMFASAVPAKAVPAKKGKVVASARVVVQGQFDFVRAVTVFAEWVRPAVMVFKPWKKSGERDSRVTYAAWLQWHAPLNGGAR